MRRNFTLLALAAMMLLPQALMAESWTKYVTNKKEYQQAVAAIGGVAGETYEIILAGPKQADGTYAVADATFVIDGSNDTWSTAKDGTVIIRSEQTDMNNLPRLGCGINMTDMPEDNKFQLIIENVSLEYRTGNLATSGQIIYWSGNDPTPKDVPVKWDADGNPTAYGKGEAVKKPIADAIIIRNCQICDIPRTLYRSVPGSVWNEELQQSEYAEVEKNHLRYFELSGCKIHDMNLTDGNKWSLLVFGQAVDEIVIKDNIIYNLPFSKGLLEISRVSDLGSDTKLTVENNTIIMGRPETGTDANGKEGSTGALAALFNPGANFGISAEYTLNNNIIMLPPTGVISAEVTNSHTKSQFTIDSYTPTKLLNAKYGMVTAKNNVIDWNGYNDWSAGNIKEEGEYTWLQADTTANFTLEESGLTFASFYDAENHNYILEKSNKLYTMADGQPIGAPMMYVDAFPVAASLTVNVEGSRFVDFDVVPAKEKYFNGDEVTITLNDHNSAYRTFNTFKGWSDGSMENPRKVTIEGATELTAQYEEAVEGLVSAFDFSSFTARNNKLEEVKAEINADENNVAVAHGFAIDADSDESNDYVQCTASAAKATFQGVLNKFGEDDADKQMNVLSRRSSDLARAAKKHNYAQFELSTKGLTGINFSCFVGGDNIILKKQLADWSADGSNWTNFASVELEQRDATFLVDGEETAGKLAGWAELKGTLPAEAENLDKLYIRVISDPESEPLWSVSSLEATKDTGVLFEYVGNVLITAGNGSQGIQNVSNTTDATSAPLYNLMGIRVNSQAKGLLIQNGKKVVVK